MPQGQIPSLGSLNRPLRWIAAGGYAFGPIGAAAGALLARFLFDSNLRPDIEGPRLGDLDVSSNSLSGVIPLGFGVRVIRTSIDEDKNQKEGGGLFGVQAQVPESLHPPVRPGADPAEPHLRCDGEA